MGIDTRHFSYEQIRKGTEEFSIRMQLGVGAFGKVYKVVLNNTLFACKVLKIVSTNKVCVCVRVCLCVCQCAAMCWRCSLFTSRIRLLDIGV